MTPEEVMEIIRERDRLHAIIVGAHVRGLPKHWAYTDPITTVDLLVAECSTCRTECDALSEALRLLLALLHKGAFGRWGPSSDKLVSAVVDKADAALALVQSHAERPQSQNSQEKV